MIEVHVRCMQREYRHRLLRSRGKVLRESPVAAAQGRQSPVASRQ
jgi:hypothetical protein